jgi:hypothetical protein
MSEESRPPSPSHGRSPSLYRRLRGAERELRVYEMKLEGAPNHEIAASLGCSVATVAKILHKVLKRAEEAAEANVDQLRKLDAARLDSLFRSLYPLATKGTSNSPRAAEVCIKIMERKARLLGLDAPIKQEIDINLTLMNDDELLEQARRHRLEVQHLKIPDQLPGEAAAAIEVSFEEILPHAPDPGTEGGTPEGNS